MKMNNYGYTSQDLFYNKQQKQFPEQELKLCWALKKYRLECSVTIILVVLHQKSKNFAVNFDTKKINDSRRL